MTLYNHPSNILPFNDSQQEVLNHLLFIQKDFENKITQHPLISALGKQLDVTVSLVGGAVRDLVCEKSIKDVDILVNFNPSYTSVKASFDKNLNKKEILEIQKHNYLFIEEYGYKHNLIPLDKSENQHINHSQIIVHLLAQALKDLYEVEKVYSHSILYEATNPTQSEIEEYTNLNINGVVKMSSQLYQYPVDVLISQAGISNILAQFDFDLCKIALINDTFLDHDSEEKTLILFPTNDFFKDFDNKTLNYNPVACNYVKTLKQAERSFSLHLPRLLDKFPEYKPGIRPFMQQQNPDNYNEIEKLNLPQLLDKYLLNHKLKTQLKNTDETTILKPRKNKI